MRHFYQFRFGSISGLLIISLIIALSAIGLLLLAMSHIDPELITQDVSALFRNTTL